VQSSSLFGHAGHQGPDDGETQIVLGADDSSVDIGQLVRAKVIDSSGVDLIAELVS
jgi:hypothetical protein